MSIFSSTKEEGVEIVLEGQLDKEGRVAKATKTRWFVLTPTVLTYYTDETKNVKKESMFLTTDSDISPVDVHTSLSRSTNKYKFTITGTDSNSILMSMTLVSTDEVAVNTWIEKLTEVKESNSPSDVSALKKAADKASGKNSTALRMQKFMASKLAGSSVGQDMIASVVDDTTRNIISALILSIKKFAGEEESLKIKENCFKIVTKLGVLYQNKVMQKDDFVVFAQFSDNLIMTISRILMQVEDSVEPVIENSAFLEKKLSQLSSQFVHFQSEGFPILQKYMKESNSERLNYLTEIFSQKELWKCILIGQEYEEIRDVLRDMLYSS